MENSITEQAYNWFDRLRNADAADRASFAEWLKTSPRHVGEFLLVTAVYRRYQGPAFAHDVDVERMIAEAGSNVIPLMENSSVTMGHADPPAQPMRRRRSLVSIAAALAMLAILGGGWVWTRIEANRYTTAQGELRVIELTDGSTLHLNTQSSVRVRMSAAARDIDLLSGEALFKVARDPRRPFRVHSGVAVIQAVGTEFNVYRRTAGTTVSVIEGRVAVGDGRLPARRYLGAGEAVEVARGGALATVVPVDPLKVAAWGQRRLVFRGDTLAEVVAEFNRYNKKPQFDVRDPAVAGRKFTGVFDADAPESFVRVLSGTDDLAIERRDGRILVRKKGNSP